ncbi:hypothetical protein K435DRAFT_784692 [Dendrothele bispora CBS 962.96]|uniref:Uncharacterized protein n=1 Tax=Dendrothele bispora (strain CBS 962.96) TaxID=1314807 RepID=A0A4S8L1I6_DENBC|nr:hypothetical protein K435DRAFT_784692 [Dendrothele bispora CBS 962.96]
MDSHQKQRRKKAKTLTNSVAPIRRSSRIAARQGWRIPPEILLLIMKGLCDSKVSLKTAALVCRAWRGPAQVYMFSQMHIRQSQDCSRISKIIQKSPHLTSHVNTLFVEEHYAYSPRFGSIKDRPLISRVSYLQSRDATKIAPILGSSVQTLKVEQCDEMRVDMLAELIQDMRNLTSLHLFGGEIAPNADEYVTDRLESLATTSSTLSTEPTVDTSPFRLTRLTLDRIEHRFGLLKFLLDSGHFDLGALENLDLTWMEADDQSDIAALDYTFLDRLFRRVGTNLKGLMLGFWGMYPRDQYLEHYTMNPTNSPLRCLVTLESFSIISQEHSKLDPSLYLALLTSVPSSSLTHMRLQTVIDVYDFATLTPAFFAQPEEDPAKHWKAVDSLLGDENRFPVLKSLTITVVLEFESDISELTLHDTEACRDPICFDCVFLINRGGKEMANKHTEESIDQTSMQIVGLFEGTLTRLKERGLLNVEIEKRLSY